MYFNIKISLKLLNLLGLNPYYNQRRSYKILFYTGLSAILATISFGFMLFIFEEKLTIVNVVTSLEAISMMIHTLGKYIVLYKNSGVIISLIDDTELFWSVEKYPFHEEKQSAVSYLKNFKISFIYNACFASFASLFFILSPLISYHRILPLTSYVPENPAYYIVFLIVEEYTYIIAILSVVSFDTIFGSLTILAAMQWKLLNRRFQAILNSKVGTPEKKYIAQQELKICVDYHNFLIRYVSRMNDALFFALTPYAFIAVVSICSELFIISSNSQTELLLKCISYGIGLLNEYVLFYCIPGQKLTDEAEMTVQYLSTSKWYGDSSNFKKTMMNIIIPISKRPIGISIAKIFYLNYENMLKSFRMIISYYMFLKTIEVRPNVTV